MKRILLMITKGDIGGAQVSVFLLAKALKKRHFDVSVGMGAGDLFLQKKLELSNVPVHIFRHLRRSQNIIQNLAFILEFKKFLSHNPYDVLHLNSSNTLLAGISAKLFHRQIKTIFTHRGLSLIDPKYTPSSFKRFFYRILLRVLLVSIDIQVFVSNRNQIHAQKMHIAKRDVVIYNGLDPDTLFFYSKQQARHALEKYTGKTLDQTLLIGSIGRLAYQKNYEFLVRQMATLTNKFRHLSCVIIGDGPDATSLKNIIQKYNLEKYVSLTGAIPDAASYMPAFDIFILPSRYEGFSITLVEALLAGLPIVASDVGGNEETLGNAGLTYPLDNEETFQKYIASLIQDPGQRASLAEKARKRSALFTIDKTTQEYIRLYEQPK